MSFDLPITQTLGRWQPILQEASAHEVRQRLAGIAEDLRGCRMEDPSLGGGNAGVALFYAHLSAFWPDRGYEWLAMDRLSRAVEGASSDFQPYAFFGGFTGIAWLVNHLSGWFLDADQADMNRDVDEALLGLCEASPWRGSYDLVLGLVGLGQYALDRRHTPMGRHLVSLILERLAERATVDGSGLCWVTPPEELPAWQRALHPDGHVDLGLAHGMPAVLAWLGRVTAAGLADARTQRLIEAGMAWFQSRQSPDPAAPSCFLPQCPVGARSEATSSRIAWCYGDLGISLALLGAGIGARRPDWIRWATDVARSASARPFEDSGVKDPGLCHGSAGNALLFNRLFQATGEPVFREAARAWVARTLSYHTEGRGLGGFSAWNPEGPEDPQPWRAKAGLIEGSAGIGLALLAAVSDQEPTWDRLLGYDLGTPPWSPVASP